jgi:dTDP-glucose 4,6-dehydratase
MRKTVRGYLVHAYWIAEIERKYQLQRLGQA